MIGYLGYIPYLQWSVLWSDKHVLYNMWLSYPPLIYGVSSYLHMATSHIHNSWCIFNDRGLISLAQQLTWLPWWQTTLMLRWLGYRWLLGSTASSPCVIKVDTQARGIAIKPVGYHPSNRSKQEQLLGVWTMNRSKRLTNFYPFDCPAWDTNVWGLTTVFRHSRTTISGGMWHTSICNGDKYRVSVRVVIDWHQSTVVTVVVSC